MGYKGMGSGPIPPLRCTNRVSPLVDSFGYFFARLVRWEPRPMTLCFFFWMSVTTFKDCMLLLVFEQVRSRDAPKAKRGSNKSNTRIIGIKKGEAYMLSLALSFMGSFPKNRFWASLIGFSKIDGHVTVGSCTYLFRTSNSCRGLWVWRKARSNSTTDDDLSAAFYPNFRILNIINAACQLAHSRQELVILTAFVCNNNYRW